MTRRKNQTDHALDALNAARGLTYPMIGYTYQADIFGGGPGDRRVSVWAIINEGGGVSQAYEFTKHPKGAKRVAAIREATYTATVANEFANRMNLAQTSLASQDRDSAAMVLKDVAPKGYGCTDALAVALREEASRRVARWNKG